MRYPLKKDIDTMGIKNIIFSKTLLVYAVITTILCIIDGEAIRWYFSKNYLVILGRPIEVATYYIISLVVLLLVFLSTELIILTLILKKFFSEKYFQSEIKEWLLGRMLIVYLIGNVAAATLFLFTGDLPNEHTGILEYSMIALSLGVLTFFVMFILLQYWGFSSQSKTILFSALTVIPYPLVYLFLLVI